MKYIVITLLAALIMITGCAKPQEPNKPAKVWLKEGLTQFENEDYKDAAASFENAIKEAETPELAAKAQLFLGDSYFQMENYQEAIPSYQEYLTIYSSSLDAPKALHRIGLSYYRQLESVDRDQSNTELALESFIKLSIDYPKYSQELLLDSKVNELRDMLAEKEIYIAKFYFRINEDEAAEHHLKRFLINYKDTSLYPQAALMLGEYLLKQKDREDEGVVVLTDLLEQCHNPKMLKRISNLLKKYASRLRTR